MLFEILFWKKGISFRLLVWTVDKSRPPGLLVRLLGTLIRLSYLENDVGYHYHG